MQTILKSEGVQGQENMISVVVKLFDVKSPRYQNVEMDIDVKISQVHMNWNPIVLNRLLRFIRFIKYPWDIRKQEELVI